MRLSLTLLSILIASLPLVAQQDTVRVGVELVVVPVSVRDSNEQFVSDLRKEDFRIREAGRAQVIRSVSLESMPLSAALLIDTGFELKQFSITSLAGAFGSNDEVAVYGFDQTVTKACSFTNARDTLEKALRTIDETAAGLTHRIRNLDAGLLAVTLDLRERPAGRKKIIVVISPAGCGSNLRPSEEARERLSHE